MVESSHSDLQYRIQSVLNDTNIPLSSKGKDLLSKLCMHHINLLENVNSEESLTLLETILRHYSNNTLSDKVVFRLSTWKDEKIKSIILPLLA